MYHLTNAALSDIMNSYPKKIFFYVYLLEIN